MDIPNNEERDAYFAYLIQLIGKKTIESYFKELYFS